MESVEQVLPVRNCLGEGPVWNPAQSRLYWVDIEGRSYQWFCPSTGELETVQVGVKVGVLRFRSNQQMIMATQAGIQFWDPQEKILTTIIDPEQGKTGARFNDGAIDPQGRFWAGTMSPGQKTSSLYRLDKDLSLQKMDSGMGVSNGTGWSPDGRTMYFTDSSIRTIFAYDFDPVSGDIENRRIFSQTPDEPGVPDGLTVDSAGFVWSARWGGWKINRYDPDGKLEREIAVPVEFPTSCTFGGDDLADLYITSAWTQLGEAKKDTQPQAGHLFRLHTHFRGQAEPYFREETNIRRNG